MRSKTQAPKSKPVTFVAGKLYRHKPTECIVLCVRVNRPASPAEGICLNDERQGAEVPFFWNLTKDENYVLFTDELVLSN